MPVHISDVMLLVSLGEEEIKRISDQVSDLALIS